MIIVEAAKNPIKVKGIKNYTGWSFINNEIDVDESIIKKVLSNKSITDDFFNKADKIIEERYAAEKKYWIGKVPSLDEVKKAATLKIATFDYNGKDKDHYLLILTLTSTSDKFFNNRGAVEGYYLLNKDGSLNKVEDVYFDGSD